MVKNRAYKKWLITEGKQSAALILDVFIDCLNRRHNLANEIMMEAKAEHDIEGAKKAVEMIMKQCQ